MFEPFTKDERDEMLRTFVAIDKDTLIKAETVAALLAESVVESNVELDLDNALLALKFFYCQPENKKTLEEMFTKLSLD